MQLKLLLIKSVISYTIKLPRNYCIILDEAINYITIRKIKSNSYIFSNKRHRQNSD